MQNWSSFDSFVPHSLFFNRTKVQNTVHMKPIFGNPQLAENQPSINNKNYLSQLSGFNVIFLWLIKSRITKLEWLRGKNSHKENFLTFKCMPVCLSNECNDASCERIPHLFLSKFWNVFNTRDWLQALDNNYCFYSFRMLLNYS